MNTASHDVTGGLKVRCTKRWEPGKGIIRCVTLVVGVGALESHRSRLPMEWSSKPPASRLLRFLAFQEAWCLCLELFNKWEDGNLHRVCGHRCKLQMDMFPCSALRGHISSKCWDELKSLSHVDLLESWLTLHNTTNLDYTSNICCIPCSCTVAWWGNLE